MRWPEEVGIELKPVVIVQNRPVSVPPFYGLVLTHESLPRAKAARRARA